MGLIGQETVKGKGCIFLDFHLSPLHLKAFFSFFLFSFCVFGTLHHIMLSHVMFRVGFGSLGIHVDFLG